MLGEWDAAAHSQFNVYISGGISINTLDKKIWSETAQMTFSPMVDIGGYYDLKDHFRFGLAVRYSQLSLTYQPRIIAPNRIDYTLGKRERVNEIGTIIVPMFIFGPTYRIKNIKLAPGFEAGVALSKVDPSPIYGLRFDVTIQINKQTALLIGVSGTRYKIKYYECWYFPVRAGISIAL